jgi:hypothetical protein
MRGSKSEAPALGRPTGLSFQPTNVRRITFGDGCEAWPAFTPDGRSLVFSRTDGSAQHIVVRTLVDGVDRPLTDGRVRDGMPAVSPDGARVAFERFDGENRMIFMTDISGATPPQRIGRGVWGQPSWSRDGRGVWTGQIPLNLVEATPLDLIDAATPRQLRAVGTPRDAWVWTTRELSSGALVIASVDQEPDSRKGLGLVPPGGDFRWIFDARIAEALTITPDERHALVTVIKPLAVPELYAVPLDGSPPRSLLSSTLTPTAGIAFSPDGRSIAWSTCDRRISIARIGESGKLLPLRARSSWDDVYATGIPGSSHLLVVSNRSGSYGLWEIDLSEA